MRGKDVWMDVDGIRDAEVFPEALRQAIESSNGFVFVISPASVNSEYCRREVGDAVDAGKRIVPVDFEHVPDDDVPEPIRVRNWIPVSDDDEALIARVVKALDTDLDHLKQHTHWELKAREWDDKDRDKSLLLRGAELDEAETWLAAAEAKDPGPTPLQHALLTASRLADAKRQRRLATVSVAVAVASIALLVFALIQRSQADSARKTSESRALAFSSEAQDQVDPERALLIAMQATKARPTPDALFALRSALDADPLIHRFPSFGAQNCQQPAPGVNISPVTGVLAVGLCSGRIVLIGPNNKVQASILQPDPAAPLRFNPNGLSLAVAGNGRIRLYSPGDLSWRGELRVPGYPQRIVFSGDGSRMAATSETATRSWTSVWDTRNSRLTMRESEPAASAALAPVVRGIGFVDGNRALAIGNPIGAVRIVATEGGQTLRTLPGKEDALVGVDPDGRFLVVAGFHTHGLHSREGVVTLWDTARWGKPHVVAAVEGLRPRNLVVSRDATKVAVGWSDGSAAIYSLLLNSQLVRFLGPPQPVSALTYSPDSNRVVIGAADGSVRIWRAGGAESAYAEIGARLDWDRPAVAGVVLTVLTPPNVVQTLSLPALHNLGTHRLPIPPGTRFTYGWLAPSGNVAVMIRDDGRADAMDTHTGRVILSEPALVGALAAVDNEDARMLLLDGRHNEIVDLRTGSTTAIHQEARLCPGSWRAARFSDDGSIVVAGSNCGEVLAWRAKTGKLLRRITLPGQITGLALTGTGRTVAVASPDGHLVLVDLTTGAQRAIPGAPRGIATLSIGDNDRLLAAGATDRTVRIWDLQSLRLLRELPLAAAPVVRFTPDGRKLLAAQLTGALSLFDPCPGCGNEKALMSEAAKRVTRKLTPEERKTYLSGF